MASVLMRLLWPLAMGLALAACGGGDGANPAPTPTPAPSPATAEPTAPGVATGAAVTQRIGPAGGRLDAADGRLTLIVPAGAFDREHEIGIQPISNTAHGAKAAAYRITPEGLGTPRPMTLVFHLDDEALLGTAFDALSIGTQDGQGLWHSYRAPRRDVAARTLSVDTTHFSDWVVLAGVQLRPTRAQVVVGSSIELTIMDCPRLPGAPESETTVVTTCRARSTPLARIDGWAANGLPGGSAAVGTVLAMPEPAPDDSNDAHRARFTAPAAPPPGNPVAVSVDYREVSPGATPLRLVSRIDVVTPDACAWVRNAPRLSFDIELAYEFSGASGGATLSLNQRGRMTGEMVRVAHDDLFGTWQGTTTLGDASLADTLSSAGTTQRLAGSGRPAIGSGANQNDYSGAQLVVDYRNCRYALSAKLAVLAGSGAAGDEPQASTVGGFTRGWLAIGPDGGLTGRETMPPRPSPDPAGTYLPGGLERGRLFNGGFATPDHAGRAEVRWWVMPP